MKKVGLKWGVEQEDNNVREVARTAEVAVT